MGLGGLALHTSFNSCYSLGWQVVDEEQGSGMNNFLKLIQLVGGSWECHPDLSGYRALSLQPPRLVLYK